MRGRGGERGGGGEGVERERKEVEVVGAGEDGSFVLNIWWSALWFQTRDAAREVKTRLVLLTILNSASQVPVQQVSVSLISIHQFI